MAHDLTAQLRALAHIAKVLNARQHAGLKITPVMWAHLYDETVRAEALIASYDRQEA